MSQTRLNLIGQKFGRLFVESFSHTNHQSYWKCICDCGNVRIVIGMHLKNEKTKSCGCLCKEIVRKAKTTHGMTNTATYNIWCSIKKRCYNPKNKDFFRYGGRGIKVCERWHIFENFLADMGEKPSPKHSIDRINNDGNYEPDNCRWATAKEQANNRRMRSCYR